MAPQEKYRERLERARRSKVSSTRREVEMRDMQDLNVVWTSSSEGVGEEVDFEEVRIDMKEEGETVKVRDAQNDVERIVQRIGKRMGYNVRFKDI